MPKALCNISECDIAITNKWKIEFGGLTKEQLLFLLSTNKICMNAYTALLFMDENFVTSPESRVAEIIEISVEALGFKAGASYRDILLASETLSLDVCPLEIAPQFRIQYHDQNDGARLTIASLKTKSDENYPNGFYLSHYSGFFWLRGYRSTSDWIWGPDEKLSFVESYA
jgi:hypothetical protein